MKRMIMAYITKFISVVILLLLLTSYAFGQDFVQGPSTGIMDSKSIFANPAVLSFQNAQVAMGVKGYHLGFFEESGIGYREGYLSVLTPRLFGTRFGGGAQIQYFDSPIFRKAHYGATFSYRIMSSLSFGVNASLYHLSYNRDNFVDFDFDDPVFQDGFSRFAFNSSAGIYFRPVSTLELALGARNITEPNVSLVSDDATEPREIFAGVSLRHNMLKGTLELIHGQFGIQTRTHAELYSSSGYYVRAGTNLNFDSGYIEAQAHITRGYSINYQFELPLNELAGNTNGSHMLSLVYEFNRVPSLPAKRQPPQLIPSLERPPVQPNLSGTILLSSQTDHVMYYEKQIIRRVDETTVTEQELQALSIYDIGELGTDPRTDRVPYSKDALPTAPIPETVEFTTSVSPSYNEAVEMLANILTEDQLDRLRIIYNQGTEIRAAGLRNLLYEKSGKPIQVSEIVLETSRDTVQFDTPATLNNIRDEQLIEIQPENARIQTVITENIALRNWNLEITDRDGRVVKIINGGTSIPDVIEWDWLNDSGELIDPGVYTYVLNWTTSNGEQYRSNVRSLYVQKILRKITIDISKDLNRILENPDEIDIILKNN